MADYSGSDEKVVAAARANNVQAIYELVANGARVDAVIEGGFTAIFIAAQSGSQSAVQVLTKLGANVNQKNKAGAFPAFVAAQYGHTGVVRDLVAAGANIDVEYLGSTPAMIARSLKHHDTEALLTDRRALDRIRAEYCAIGDTRMVAAARANNVQAIYELVANGARVDAVIEGGFTATFIAAQSGSQSAVQLLARLGADVNQKNKAGAFPAFVAAQYGHTGVVRDLVAAGADINIKFLGSTPAMIARAQERYETEALLLDRRALDRIRAEYCATEASLKLSELKILASKRADIARTFVTVSSAHAPVATTTSEAQLATTQNPAVETRRLPTPRDLGGLMNSTPLVDWTVDMVAWFIKATCRYGHHEGMFREKNITGELLVDLMNKDKLAAALEKSLKIVDVVEQSTIETKLRSVAAATKKPEKQLPVGATRAHDADLVSRALAIQEACEKQVDDQMKAEKVRLETTQKAEKDTEFNLKLERHGGRQIELDDLTWPDSNSEHRFEVGRGAFKVARRGVYMDHDVCILEIKMDDIASWEKENEVMAKLSKHPYIARYYGRSFDVTKKLLYIVTEYYKHGSLNDAMSDLEALTVTQNMSIAYQISLGMTEIARLDIVHCDLAARNVLLKSVGKYCPTKVAITDFGLGRILQSGTHATYEAPQEGITPLIPIFWAAPEIVTKTKPRYSEKSDVWSFAVTLWEIFSNYEQPWLHCMDTLVENLKKGARLDKPKDCPSSLYSLMCECWTENPAERPKFEEISLELCRIATKEFDVPLAVLTGQAWGQCVICLSPIEEGVHCEDGHTICVVCFEEFTFDEMGAVHCVYHKYGCEAVFQLADLLKVLPEKLITRLLKEHKQSIEQTVGNATRDQIEKERERASRNKKENPVQFHIEHIQESFLNLRCPVCLRVFNEFENCLALRCSNESCGAHFCGLCLTRCKDSPAAHRHLPEECQYNPKKLVFLHNKVSGDAKWAEFNLLQRPRQTRLIRDYLDSLEKDIKTMVTKQFSGELKKNYGIVL